MENNNSYKIVFKSTFLFGFVQIFNILVKVGINKSVAIFLGAEGMGVIGLLQSTLSVISTACGFGISQSAVKDISHGCSVSRDQYSKSISITKKISLYLALFGAITVISLSPFLSQWTFGNSNYTHVYLWLSLVVFFNILSEGQLAILKGSRKLRLLAKSSLWGSVVGLFTSVPLYYWLGEKGIVPSLIVAACAVVVFSWLFVRQVDYERNEISFKKAIKEGREMILMGGSLMYVGFLATLSDYIIRLYISNVDSINTVGLFQAGSMIITSYFGIVITALTTDYYPRISAINENNKLLQREFNKQSEVGLLLVGALVIIFMFAMHLLINVLYTKSFSPMILFLEYAILGILFSICSNSLGMILLAKQASKTFFITATIGRVVIVTVSLLFFHLWGLKGLGIAAIVTAIFHLCLMSFVLWIKYNIVMNRSVVSMLIIIIIFSLFAFGVKEINSLSLRYCLGIALFAFYIYYSIYKIKKVMGINIVAFVKRKFK